MNLFRFPPAYTIQNICLWYPQNVWKNEALTLLYPCNHTYMKFYRKVPEYHWKMVLTLSFKCHIYFLSMRTFKEGRVSESRSLATVPFFTSSWILSPETPRHRLRTRYRVRSIRYLNANLLSRYGQVTIHLRTVAQLDEGVIESKLTTRSLFAIKQTKSLQ